MATYLLDNQTELMAEIYNWIGDEASSIATAESLGRDCTERYYNAYMVISEYQALQVEKNLNDDQKENLLNDMLKRTGINNYPQK